jgi:glutamine synthetase
MADRPRSVEEVRTLVDEMGIEFVFAQFVEMYGKANAKLVPATHLEDVFCTSRCTGWRKAEDRRLGTNEFRPTVMAG